jgi:Uma2 family endonuclease
MAEMSLHEIVLPETRPETEWVRGRALQKTGGVYRHARLQLLWTTALFSWAEAGNHGRIAMEWRFRVTPPDGPTRPLVPDVAYLSYEAVPADAPVGDVQVPLMAPTVAIEILSPEDLREDVNDKITTYLADGCRAVILVDPEAETVVVHDREGSKPLPALSFATPRCRG